MNDITSSINYKADSVIYESGDSAYGFYYVSEGCVELHNQREYGDVLFKNVYAGEVFGVLEFASGCKRTHKAVACMDSVVSEINSENIGEFIVSFPSKTIDILNNMSELVRDANDALVKTRTRGQSFSGNKSINITEDEGNIMIDGERQYAMMLPKEHEDYLFLREVDCPVCEKQFKVNHIRYSKLIVLRQMDDFRKKYKDFDDIWYQVWSCPYCSYTNFHNLFFSINNKVRKELSVSLPRLNPSESSYIKKNINDVLNDYYKMSRMISSFSTSSLVAARLWQCIAWIMEDVGDYEMVDKANEILLKYLQDGWYNSGMVLEPDDEVKLAYKIALLSLKNKDYKTAIDYLFNAAKVKGANKIYKTKVQDKLIDVKDEYRAIKNKV